MAARKLKNTEKCNLYLPLHACCCWIICAAASAACWAASASASRKRQARAQDAQAHIARCTVPCQCPQLYLGLADPDTVQRLLTVEVGRANGLGGHALGMRAEMSLVHTGGTGHGLAVPCGCRRFSSACCCHFQHLVKRLSHYAVGLIQHPSPKCTPRLSQHDNFLICQHEYHKSPLTPQ